MSSSSSNNNLSGQSTIKSQIQNVIRGMSSGEHASRLKVDIDTIIRNALDLGAGNELRNECFRVADAFGYY